MVKVRMFVDGKEKTVLVPEMKKLRDLVSENGVDPEKAFVLIGERKCGAEDWDRSMVSLADGADSCTVLVYPFRGADPFVDEDELPFPPGMEEDSGDSLEDCSPDVMIAGCACVITSVFTREELERFKEFAPELLTMVDDSGQPVFAIDIADDTAGSLNRHGAVFGAAASASGQATITVLLGPSVTDRRDAVRTTLGSALLNLRELEDRLKKHLPEVEAKIRQIDEMIVEM